MTAENKRISPHRDGVKTSEDLQGKMTLRDQIESMADRYEDAAFLLSPETNRRTTYRQLAQRADNFCRKLLTRGLTPGDTVASLLDNGLFTAEWLLGTMYGGFVPVPLNPCLAAPEIGYLLENSEAKIFFVAREHMDFVRPFVPAHLPFEVIDVDDPIAHDGKSERRLPEFVQRGEDDALMVYTSGSTGRPKGVVVSHRNLINGGQNTVNAHQLTEQDRSLCVLPLYHMNAQIITLIATLMSGGSVVVTRQFKAASFWSWVGNYHCTWSALVPSLISQLVQAPTPHKLQEQCACLRFVRSSSAPLSPSLLQVFEATFSLPLIEAMGMTEAGGAIFSNPLPPAPRKTGSPGLPWGFECRIVDSGGSDIPNSCTGEILVRGPSLMKGYFKDSKATAEIIDSDGWLRTGDLGYKDDDGFVFIRGRSKEMINRGGEKIAPREIDETLARHPAVDEAVAIGVPDLALGEDIVACVVLRDDTTCTEDDLLEYCRSDLGMLKTPSRIHFVDDLPRGSTGKVQRLKLAARLSTSPAGTFTSDVGTANQYPRTQHEVESKLIDLWSVFLKCERVQAKDNFFALGGNSLLAIRMLSRLRKCFGVELPLSFFFEYPTVVGQAGMITRMDKQSQVMLENVSNSSEEKKVFSLSGAQQHLLFIQRMYPNISAYNEAEAFHLEGPVDIAALEQTIDAIIARHEMLRTTIEYASDVPVQVVHQHLALRLLQHDLSHVPQGEREEALQSALTTHMRQPFELERQLLRVALIKLTANEHVLLLMLHHLICDSWSMGILHRELTQFYPAFKKKKLPTLEPLRYQYATFVEHEHTRLSDANAIGPEIAFWKDKLSNAPELLALPTDRPHPAIFSHRGARVPVRIDRELSQSMRQMAQQEKVSLFTLVATAFNTLLFLYSGQPDILLGIPIAHRDQVEFMPLIGVFVDTVVLRSDLSGGPLFDQVLVKTGFAIAEALRHRAVPFGQLIESRNLTRTLDRAPLFQIMFNWRDPETQTDLLCLDGLRVRPMEVDGLTAKFDLTLSLTDTGNEITGHMEFNTDLWNRSSICRMLDHYHFLLKGIVANPHRPISEYPLLTDTEQHRLLIEWNKTTADYPRLKCIHELFEEQVEQTPDAIAIIFEDQQLTYHELNKRANQLAQYLQTLGIGPEARVGLCMEPSSDLMVSLLGILKAGGAYVPLDPEYPTERLEFMLQDMTIQVLVTHSALSQRLLNPGPVVCLDEDQELLQKCHDGNPVGRTQAGNLAYVMYTSGSTGQPIGVCAEHRAVIRLVRGTSYATFSSEEVYWHLAPLAFDASTFEIWGALLHGARLVVLPKRRLTFDEIGGAIRQYQITTLWLTASLFHVMVSERIEALKPLRLLLVGGDVLSVQQVEQVRRELKGCRLVNGYGPTEGTTFSCCYTVPLEGSLGDTVPIGRPISNTTTYILDAHRQPVPISIRGELYIGGEGLARGYWNRPDLTAEKFVPHSFDHQPGARLFKTGDGARYLSDGNVEFLGRRDHQVKIRGYRIELGEIEATLEQQASVRQAIVLAREDIQGEKRLVAYIIPAKERVPASGELRATLSARLPDYMIPNFFVLLVAFPLTPNGKVDRKALPPPEWKQIGRTETVITPRTKTERKLAEIWCQILGLERVRIHDHFFSLGGHSLLAMRLTTRIHLEFGVDLPIKEIFEIPTLDKMAKRIEVLGVSSDSFLSSPVTEQVPQASAPASFAQERMWFLHQSTPNSALYNQSFAFRIRGDLQVEALGRSLQALEERHAPLRTTFALLGDQVKQHIQPASEFPLIHEDLSLMPSVTREDLWQAIASHEASRLFNLSKGPLWRGRLFRLSNAEHVLLLAFHHICMDEWSLRIFREELSALYAGFAVGQTVTLAPLPSRYVDYAQWQRQWLASSVADNQLEYWRTMLGRELPVLNLPTDYPRLSVPNERGATERRLLSSSLLEQLKKLSADQEMTLFMTLLGAFQVLLSRYCGQDDIVVGTPIANRDLSKFQGLVGLFLNTMTMRCDLSGQPTIRETLTRVRKMALEAYTHRNVPFEKVVQAIRGMRDGNTAPLFQVMFVLKNLEEHTIPLGPLETTLLPVSTGTAKFDLTLFLEAKPEGLHAVMEYRTDLFEPTTIQRMLGNLELLLEEIVTDPEKRIGELPLLAESEQHQALVEWNQTAADYPRDACIHQLFEAQVTRMPDAVAIVFEDCHVTYRELNSRANRLAHHLKKLGVGPEVQVGLCIERSIAMVVGLLGILKAGGTYVPLDPGYPAERLAFMLQDVKPTVVLANQEPANLFKQFPFQTVPLNEMLRGSAEVSNLSCQASPDNLAYLLFTSGSTGQPKAVAVQHRTLVNLVTWQNLQSSCGADDRTLQFSSLSFDVSLQETFTALCGGGTLLIMPEETRRDLPELVQQICDQRVTRLFLPFVLLEELIQAFIPLDAPPTWLREIITAGEQLRITSSVTQLFERLSHTILVNQYGPTEAHVVSHYTLGGSPSAWMLLPPIGQPISNMQLYILDETLHPVPISVQGELYIGGEGLARGYWHRPALTAEKFVPNQFDSQPGTRLYTTGDWARYRPNGNIEFIGRRGDQVKVRGYRIELGEIEATLEQHESVRQAIVVARETAPDNKQLVAYVTPTKDRALTRGELRETLAARLPDYMVPNLYVLLDAFPLTPNGKVDRRGLPAPRQIDRVQTRADESPRTPLEKLLVELWTDLLKVDGIGVHENFFALGGHSLLATRVVARLRTMLDLDLPVRTLFEHPTVAEFAMAIDSQLVATFPDWPRDGSPTSFAPHTT